MSSDKQPHKPVPFLQKLQAISYPPPNPSTASAHWNEDGTIFVVENTDAFCQSMQGQYATIIRQLHFYGFQKLKEIGKYGRSPESWAFRHTLFTRDHPQEMLKIKRFARAKDRREEEGIDGDDDENNQSTDDYIPVEQQQPKTTTSNHKKRAAAAAASSKIAGQIEHDDDDMELIRDMEGSNESHHRKRIRKAQLQPTTSSAPPPPPPPLPTTTTTILQKTPSPPATSTTPLLLQQPNSITNNKPLQSLTKSNKLQKNGNVSGAKKQEIQALMKRVASLEEKIHSLESRLNSASPLLYQASLLNNNNSTNNNAGGLIRTNGNTPIFSRLTYPGLIASTTGVGGGSNTMTNKNGGLNELLLATGTVTGDPSMQRMDTFTSLASGVAPSRLPTFGSQIEGMDFLANDGNNNSNSNNNGHTTTTTNSSVASGLSTQTTMGSSVSSIAARNNNNNLLNLDLERSHSLMSNKGSGINNTTGNINNGTVSTPSLISTNSNKSNSNSNNNSGGGGGILGDPLMRGDSLKRDDTLSQTLVSALGDPSALTRIPTTYGV
jgi:hypothetical protein